MYDKKFCQLVIFHISIKKLFILLININWKLYKNNMSFVGKKKSMGELKMREKKEDLKTTIDEKIFEIMTRNNSLKEKVILKI